jgi:hypothetical protein
MNLDKLSIFSKDTDATETLRGYEYQKLRTVENWLANYLAKNNEVIYCDYEEDIFQRNVDLWISKFTQLKLYSSKNFSFSSVEVTKAISHFFTLFVKKDYTSDTVQFVFETNAAISRAYADNNAELLQNWRDNQDNINTTLLKKCADKVKSIIKAYAQQADKGIKDSQLLAKIAEAKLELDKVTDDVWEEFVKRIRWEFSDIPADQAIEKIITNINDQISQTEFPAANTDKESVFARLYYAVSEKSIQKDPDDRKLDNALLDSILLDTGDDRDKEYNKDYQAWSTVSEIKYFRPSEFYQVVNLANYCRHADHLGHHDTMWIDLLKKYIALNETPPRNKQKAIYELLWVSIRLKMLEEPKGTLIGLEDYIRQYFINVTNFDDHEALGDAAALIGIVEGSVAFGKAYIDLTEIKNWRKDLVEKVQRAITEAKDENQKCYLHEIAAELLLHHAIHSRALVFDDAFVHFDAILASLDRATLYNVNRLSNRINSFINILISLENMINEIERLEEFADKLMPYAAKTSNDHDMAKTYVARGVKYLESTERVSILRALDFFHKARTLWRNDQTKGGYILALLNISQLYATIGSNLAAKYYALSAARHATEDEDEHKRICDAFALVLLSDFQQGAWVSCLEDFRLFMSSRAEFKTTELDNDQMLLKSITEYASVLALAPRLSPQLHGLIENEKLKLGPLYTEYIAEFIDQVNTTISDDKVQKFIENKLDDAPLNDLGPTRTLSWTALGIEWQLKFSNNWITNSVGEEFMAVTQILVTELGLSKIDLHLLKSKVEITLETGDDLAPPVRLPSNDIHKWKVTIPAIIEEDYAKIQMQSAAVLSSLKFILDDISLLPKNELFAEIMDMFEKRNLSGKTLPDYLYQRLYRYLNAESNFIESQRHVFNGFMNNYSFPGSDALKWNGEISGKYSKGLSMELIQGRYENGLKVIHLSLETIKKDPRYDTFIADLRKDGWLDWQITLAMVNHVINFKVNEKMKTMTFASKAQEVAFIKSEMSKIMHTDEKENFVALPLDYFLHSSFTNQLKQVGLVVLHNWKLQSKSEFPDLQTIQQFLVDRFNFSVDDYISKSPL